MENNKVQEGRFSRFAPESRPVLPLGYRAPLDTRPIRLKIREAQEKENADETKADS